VVVTDPMTPPAAAPEVPTAEGPAADERLPLLTGRGRSAPFEVHLDVFSGPFDLLLGLIGKHKLDITEVALASVTDEFVAHIRANGTDWDLGQASEFLVVAATLLDLKAARLLPSASVEDA
jgi:segregation and condensation protein A